MVASLLGVDIMERETADDMVNEGWHLRVFSFNEVLKLDQNQRFYEQGVIWAVNSGKPEAKPPRITWISSRRVDESLLRGFIAPTLQETNCFTENLGAVGVRLTNTSWTRNISHFTGTSKASTNSFTEDLGVGFRFGNKVKNYFTEDLGATGFRRYRNKVNHLEADFSLIRKWLEDDFISDKSIASMILGVAISACDGHYAAAQTGECMRKIS